MGKASRKKKQRAPDPWVLFQEDTCSRCTKRPGVAGGVWCDACHRNGFRLMKSRHPQILDSIKCDVATLVLTAATRRTVVAMLEIVEADLVAQLREVEAA